MMDRALPRRRWFVRSLGVTVASALLLTPIGLPGGGDVAHAAPEVGGPGDTVMTASSAPYPGQPAVGTVAWGASITGNGDPVSRHEAAAGTSLGLRRTFFRWNQRTTSLPRTAASDIAAGRLPWVSIKPPSWAAVAAGRHDAEVDELLRHLDELDGPVWLTVHHEPEGGGGVNRPDDPAGPSGHLAMNRRVRARMDALGVDNVALAPILMTYTWNARSGRNPNEWWGDGVYDFLGVDHYQEDESSPLNARWYDVRAWAADRGVDVAVGEWGMRGTDAAAAKRVTDWFYGAVGSVSDGRGARVVGLSAFDSGLNSPNGSWELRGGQLQAFRTLLKDPNAASVGSAASPEVDFGGRFPDVDPRGVHADNIDELGERGITTGDRYGRFDPHGTVTRAQFASFLTRALDLDPVRGRPFTDVDPSSAHAGAIASIAAAGITDGVTADAFDPHRDLTREQMASLLARAFGLELSSTGRFVDVDPDDTHARSIDAVVTAGIASGVTDDTFEPHRPIRRDQMASLLIQALDRR